MSKKTMIKLVIFLVVMGVAGYLYAFVEKTEALYPVEKSLDDMTASIQVYEDHDMVYEFTSSHNNLTGFKMVLSQLGGKKGSLRYVLADAQGKELQSGSLKVSSLTDQKFTKINLDTIQNSKDQTYQLTLICDNSKADAVGVSVTNDKDQTIVASVAYIVWDLETLIVFFICILFLVTFAMTLVKIFRK